MIARRSIWIVGLFWLVSGGGVARGQPVVTITAPANGVNVCAGAAGVGDVVAFAGNSVPACMTYTWNWGDGTPNSNGLTANHTFPRAGAFTVTFTATPAMGAAGQAQITVNAIGGPITGNTTDARWYCNPASPNRPTLSAAVGQPGGTTYAWSLPAPGANAGAVQFVGATNGATATFQGTKASAAQGDVTVNLIYQRGTKLCPVSTTLTVAQPKALALVASQAPTAVYYPTDRPATAFYGFTGQSRKYTVNDQFNRAMDNVTVNVVVDNVRPGPNDATWAPPILGTQGTWAANAAGQFQVNYATDTYRPMGLNLVSPNSVVMGTVRETFYGGNAAVGVGCALTNLGAFPNVAWNTNGVTGW